MARREFISLSIADLENLATNHWNDVTFLKKLKNELKKRTTKRAKELLNKINNHLSSQYDSIKSETKFCSECGDIMEIKRGRYGLFWGCTSYPQCKNTIKILKSDFEN